MPFNWLDDKKEVTAEQPTHIMRVYWRETLNRRLKQNIFMCGLMWKVLFDKPRSN